MNELAAIQYPWLSTARDSAICTDAVCPDSICIEAFASTPSPSDAEGADVNVSMQMESVKTAWAGMASVKTESVQKESQC